MVKYVRTLIRQNVKYIDRVQTKIINDGKFAPRIIIRVFCVIKTVVRPRKECQHSDCCYNTCKYHKPNL